MDYSKDELIEWIVNEQNTVYLKKIQEIKEESDSWNKEFQERIRNAQTIEESKQILYKHIDSLPWKI